MAVKAIQFEPIQFQKERNVTCLFKLVEEAAQNGAKLITTPEMTPSFYAGFYTK